MIHQLSSLYDRHNKGSGEETTIHCQVASEPMPGEDQGDKTVYQVRDPYNEISGDVILSFWFENPDHIADVGRTDESVVQTLNIPDSEELEQGIVSTDDVSLQRGEELLVRAVPNRVPDDDTLFLNVTSFVIREPGTLVSKSRIRNQEHCPREYYLRYIKNVYSGDKFETPPRKQSYQFRGEAVHKITENALRNRYDRFLDESWDADLVESFCEEQLADEFGFRQALLVLSGAGLGQRDDIVDITTELFTDADFLDRIQDASDIQLERYLSEEYGYAGRVDILLDGTPYDLKTTYDPDRDRIEQHSRQIKLYLFALLLAEIDEGESFVEAVGANPSGYLVYPNMPDSDVLFEEVTLTKDDVREFLDLRNSVVKTGRSFAPPSTYNRDCENCPFSHREWITGKDDALAPACTYHCQNERRWPCYETDGGELTTQCSLFDQCEQRTEYRDPEVIDHYEGTRSSFGDERAARIAAKRLVSRLDESLQVHAGYRVPDLTCVGAGSAGTVVRFESSEPVVPAFDPGETVELRSTGGSITHKAVYYGELDGEYLFNPVDERVDVTEFLRDEATFQALYTFSAASVDDRYLPYLDFAQRRNNGQQIRATSRVDSEGEIPETVSPSAVTTYLDRKQVFVDLPVQCNRTETLANIIQELITASYPPLEDSESSHIKDPKILVLGMSPQHVECASAAQPDGPHYRIDGTGGPDRIQNEDGYHEIQKRLTDATSLVSSVQQATSKSGPGGVREFFHRLQAGKHLERDHSENFFDALILLGTEKITEPEYQFVADLADRVIAVGDRRRSGPKMLSNSATESGLDAYFRQEFERYRSFPTTTAVSLQIEGEAPPAIQTFYQEGPWKSVDGELSFTNIEGDEETVVERIELESNVPASKGKGRRLVFDVTDTPISPIEAQRLFEDRTELDATALREESVVVLDDETLYLESKDRLEGVDPTHHQVLIRTVASELPQFNRGLLSNRIAEQIVAELVSNESPDFVVTPFERHATEIKRELEERGLEVPVRRPEELTGNIQGHALVSLATSNNERIVRPPLNDPSIIYSLFGSAQDLTLVGNAETLRSKDFFDDIINEAESDSNSE